MESSFRNGYPVDPDRKANREVRDTVLRPHLKVKENPIHLPPKWETVGR
jgi:hypothetical protein